jgi:regulator of sirC expression with transglutaminase-like and TPR domain
MLAPTFAPGLQVGEGQSVAPDPIVEALSARANRIVSAAYGDAQEAYANATQTYERIIELSPRDPNIQLELGQTAQQAGDYPKAIVAYERFLELAPDDPTAPLVKQQIQQLQGAQAAGGSG